MYYGRTILAPAHCPRVVEHDGGYYACGLADWDHDGDCVWFVPGDYLPPPLLHPLDAFNAGLHRPPWWWMARCPLCGSGLTFQEAEFTTVTYVGDEVREELRWRFEPCGCVARELFAAAP